MKAPEVMLGRCVRAWLQDQQAMIYQEVEAWPGRADLVAVTEPVISVIEIKTSLSFELLHQARRWRGRAHQVWVAVPFVGNRSDGRGQAIACFEEAGAGILEVDVSDGGHVTVRARPTFNRRADVSALRGALRPEQQTLAEAGTARGGHWTAFKSTCAELRRYVEAHPGATLGEALPSIKHHYHSTAGGRSALSQLIQRGVVKGVSARLEGRSLKLYAEAP